MKISKKEPFLIRKLKIGLEKIKDGTKTGGTDPRPKPPQAAPIELVRRKHF